MTRWLMPSIIATSICRRGQRDAQRGPPLPATALQGIAVELGDDRRGAAAERTTRTSSRWRWEPRWGSSRRCLVQLPSLLSRQMYRPVLDLRHPGLRSDLDDAGADRDRLGGGPDRDILRPLFRVDASARLYVRA